MKSRSIFAVILAMVGLVITIIIGCSSSPYTQSDRRTGGFNPPPNIATNQRVDARPVSRGDLPPPTREELWIIQRSDKQAPQAGDEMIPGSGVLAAQEGEKLVPVP